MALAECCVAGGIGAEVVLEAEAEAEAELFGEGPGGFVVSGAEEALAAFGTAATVIGTVGGERLRIGGAVDVPVADLERAHRGGLADRLH